MGVFFGSAAIGYLAGLFGLKTLEKKRAAEALNKFKEQRICGVSSNVNFFGQESLGVTQMRGNGVLVLTEHELFFQMWAPQKELRIKSAAIIGVENPKTFLGKTKFKPLLKVIFKNEKNEIDSAAWLVNKLYGWQSAIEKIVEANSSNA
jgi:hypothetical protein